MPQPSQRARGMAIMFFGILAISPDALFVRFMQAEAVAGRAGSAIAIGAGSDAVLQITFYKYLWISVMQLGVTVWHSGADQLARKLKAGPKHIVAGGACQVVMSLSLNLAFVSTTVARAIFFFALSPFWAAVFARIFLGQTNETRTKVALLLVAAAIAVMFLPALSPLTDAGTATEQVSLAGDLCGLTAGAALGVLIVVSASAQDRCPDAAMLASVVLGSAAVVLISLVLQTAAGGPPMSAVSARFIGLALADAICICIVFSACIIAVPSLIPYPPPITQNFAPLAPPTIHQPPPATPRTVTHQPRYASAAEVALLNPLEVVLGPLWVYLGVGEVVPTYTMIGGALLIVSLLGHEATGILQDRRRAASAAGRVEQGLGGIRKADGGL